MPERSFLIVFLQNICTVNIWKCNLVSTRLPGARPVPSTRDPESTTWVNCGQLADVLRAELGVVQLPPWPAVCTM